MPAVISTVLEIGPATVVRSRPNRQTGAKLREEACKTSISVEMVAAALAGIDDTTVLLGEQPVAVADLWRRIIASTAETPCESLTVVCPSWWSEQRVGRIVDVAASVAADVRALSRPEVMAGNGRATVVEIADELVAINTQAGPPVVLARTGSMGDIVEAIEADVGARVLIDTPPGVTGAVEFAGAVRVALRARGVVVQLASIRDVPPASTVELVPAPATVPSRWRAPAVAAASVALTLWVIGATAARPHVPAPAVDAVDIVEGRVTLRIPPAWALTRITAGPGSRRVQASSPTEPNVALHVTQSYSPGETLDKTAEVLQQAVAEQPRGVFVDFNPADRRAGRQAVTYREVRTGRDIRWTVVLDGSTRISIGCQSAPGSADTVAEVCDKAIESAHEFTGTKSGP